MASCQAVMVPLALSLTGSLSCVGSAVVTVRAGLAVTGAGFSVAPGLR